MGKLIILNTTTTRYLRWFMLGVYIHAIEHGVQLVQLYLLHLPRKECLGLIGYFFPYLIRSELLHFAFAWYMLLGLFIFPVSSRWWELAKAFQCFHVMEHCLLMLQHATGNNLWGCTVPCSIGQLIIPRIELHAIYTAIVTGLMLIALADCRKQSLQR